MANFWKNKKVLITGNTGFKGSWLTLLLNEISVNNSNSDSFGIPYCIKWLIIY